MLRLGVMSRRGIERIHFLQLRDVACKQPQLL